MNVGVGVRVGVIADADVIEGVLACQKKITLRWRNGI